ncbi:probable low affinity copper uptake protein 2 isoform X2 [Microtus ochrogaster]|uniref:Copper transport protein n=1 Tax=Microtus ochrogaster TaxID=79684 RepID=A0ABM1U7D6_MICOH|nr:probable low affinity copper uptake protein 2 isoform X2 [Microtus ochrogaster]
MHFIFSDEAVLLFDFWRVHSPTGMALSVLVVLLLAVLYEGTKVAKAKLLHKTLENLPNTTSQQLILESDQDSTGSRSTPADGHRLRYKPRVEGWQEQSLSPRQAAGPENLSPTHRKIIWVPGSFSKMNQSLGLWYLGQSNLSNSLLGGSQGFLRGLQGTLNLCCRPVTRLPNTRELPSA